MVMAQIQFMHRGCNGWAVLDKTTIDALNARNIHVAEVEIASDDSAKLNGAGKTICGKKLKCGTLSPILMTSDAGAIRTKLADLQNSGREVCGVCASHFYEDDLP